MRYRKRAKLVEAIQVCNVLNCDLKPLWLALAIERGKVVVHADTASIVIARQVKTLGSNDWVVYDTEQFMVYGVSRQTMKSDYEVTKDMS